MSAGQPNWQRLHELGKLPKGARGHIGGLTELDEAAKLIDKFTEGCCDDCWDKFFSVKKAKKAPKE